MSAAAATAFLDRLERDEEFAASLSELTSDPNELLARIRADGFDVDEADVREAFLERYGAELSDEQLDAVAAGLSQNEAETIAFIAGAGFVIGIGVAAAF